MDSVVQKPKADPVRLFWRRVLLLALLILVLIGISGVWRIYNREIESSQLQQESATHLADLMKREQQLKADIENLNTARGKEAALRQQFQMGKPGEGMIVIVNPKAPEVIQSTTTRFSRFMDSVFPWW